MRKPRQAGPGAPSCPCGSPKRCRELAAAVDPPRAGSCHPQDNNREHPLKTPAQVPPTRDRVIEQALRCCLRPADPRCSTRRGMPSAP